jgi:hypothetical protein
LAVVPRAVEDNIAILVDAVTYGDKTKTDPVANVRSFLFPQP